MLLLTLSTLPRMLLLTSHLTLQMLPTPLSMLPLMLQTTLLTLSLTRSQTRLKPSKKKRHLSN